MSTLLIAGTDTETTGFLATDHRIIEACVLGYEYDTVTKLHRKVSSYVQRIDPQRSIDPKAQAVHGITPADLFGKPVWSSVAQAIRDELDRHNYAVAHNGMEFDFPFYMQEFDRVGVPDPDVIPFDTMLSGRWATPLGKAPSLRELCFACGVHYDPTLAHGAEYDVEVMMESFFFGLRRGVFSLST